MGDWEKAGLGETCYVCGDELTEGEDVYVSRGFTYCEGCGEDVIYDEESSYDDDEGYLIDGVGFQDPGGRSSLRAETVSNPRNLPCGQCGRENVLTPLDVQAGYVCNRCADIAEGHGY